jgi:hypothetical protein
MQLNGNSSLLEMIPDKYRQEQIDYILSVSPVFHHWVYLMVSLIALYFMLLYIPNDIDSDIYRGARE